LARAVEGKGIQEDSRKIGAERKKKLYYGYEFTSTSEDVTPGESKRYSYDIAAKNVVKEVSFLCRRTHTTG